MDTVTPRGTIKNAVNLPYISVVIKENRVRLRMSQEDLAKKIGLGLKTLRKIEQGDLSVNFQKLSYLLNFFGLNLAPVELLTSPVRRKKEVLSQDFIVGRLKHFLPILKSKYGVKELALFGSYAKKSASPNSDIDLLITYFKNISFEEEGEIQLILENLFGGAEIDLTNVANLHGFYKKEIEETKINVT